MNQKQKNIISHIKRGIIDVFNDDKDYPSEIIINSENYGKYILKPFLYINLMSDTPKAVSNVIEMIHDISPTKSSWVLKSVNYPGSDRQIHTEWIWYLIDWDSNLDWRENNKDCIYLQKVPNAKFLPIADSNMLTKIQKICDKYPMVKLDKYPY